MLAWVRLDRLFKKEIAYVQKGYLSDIPGMNMYLYVRMSSVTGFIFYRGRRSNSALEGYHLHLRAAQHPCRPRARHAALSRISLPGLQEQDVRIVRRRHPFASSRIFQGLGFRV